MNATPPHSNTPPQAQGVSPDSTALPQSSTSNGADNHPRRTSFGFLRANRTASGGKMSKKQKALAAQEELLRQQREAALPRQPPRLPSHSPLPTINTFGGEDDRPDSVAIISNRAGGYAQGGSNFSRPSIDYKMQPPAIPSSSPSNKNGEYVDPYARTESMTHRSRYSYANSTVSSINSPRRVRRRKDPTPFNILIVGAKNSGKTSFINFLRTSLSPPNKKRQQTPSPPRTALHPDSPFTFEYLETELESERIGVTLWDSPGLDKSIVDLQLKEMSSFLESKFEDTFAEEQKVVRAPGVRDTHIHCVFLILDPVRLDANIAASRNPASKPVSGLADKQRLIGVLDDDLDLQVLRTMQGKTTVIPVISKADTITTAHMAHLKKSVWDSLKQAKLDPLEALNLSDDSDADSDRFDERDEDEYNMSSSDAEDKHDENLIDKLIDRSDSDAARSSASTHSGKTGPRSSPEHSPALGSVKRPAGDGHRRRISAMSVQIAQADNQDELPFLPLSIISPDLYEPDVPGRRFPWGFADPYNAEHCDFLRLKESVFSEWRGELREASRERWYEGWRTSRLKRRGGTPRRGNAAEGLTSKTPGGRSPMNGNTPGRVSSAGGSVQGSPEMQRNLYRGVGAYQ